MATDKKFKVVGISTLKGQTKIRFANDTMRIKKLQKTGHTDIDLIELPKPMLKNEAISYLRKTKWYESNEVVQDAMDLILYRNPQGPAKQFIVNGPPLTIKEHA